MTPDQMNVTSSPTTCESSEDASPDAVTPPNLFEQPSWWLRAGFVRYGDDEGWAWIRVLADQPIKFCVQPADGAELQEPTFCHPGGRALFGHLAETFALFFPITAEQWELDLRRSPQPGTLLRLWEAVLGVYRHYTADKKLPSGAAVDYFWVILDFCNGGADYALQPRQRCALKLGRIERVIAELDRWFRRSGSL